MRQAWHTAVLHPFQCTRNRDNSKKANQIGAALDRRDALLLKATPKAFMLLKEGMRPGEELGGRLQAIGYE
jgi:hypothetical protein